MQLAVSLVPRHTFFHGCEKKAARGGLGTRLTHHCVNTTNLPPMLQNFEIDITKLISPPVSTMLQCYYCIDFGRYGTYTYM